MAAMGWPSTNGRSRRSRQPGWWAPLGKGLSVMLHPQELASAVRPAARGRRLGQQLSRITPEAGGGADGGHLMLVWLALA